MGKWRQILWNRLVGMVDTTVLDSYIFYDEKILQSKLPMKEVGYQIIGELG